jgi:hypothetical protein
MMFLEFKNTGYDHGLRYSSGVGPSGTKEDLLFVNEW